MPNFLHIDGIENAVDNLDRIDVVLRSKEVIQIFQTAGDAVKQTAQELVRKRTGATEHAIFARAYSRDTVPYCIIGVETEQPAHGHDVIHYAGFLEFGTVKMDAQPYIRPAADQWENQLLSLVGNALQTLIYGAVQSA